MAISDWSNGAACDEDAGIRFLSAPHDGLDAGVPLPEPLAIRPCPKCGGSGVVLA